MTKTKDNKEQTISIHPVKFALQAFNKVNIARKASKYLLVFLLIFLGFFGSAGEADGAMPSIFFNKF